MTYLDISRTLREAYCNFESTIVSQIALGERIKKYGKQPRPYIEYENGDVLIFLGDIEYEKYCLGRTYKIVGEDKLYHSGRPIKENTEKKKNE